MSISTIGTVGSTVGSVILVVSVLCMWYACSQEKKKRIAAQAGMARLVEAIRPNTIIFNAQTKKAVCGNCACKMECPDTSDGYSRCGNCKLELRYGWVANEHPEDGKQQLAQHSAWSEAAFRQFRVRLLGSGDGANVSRLYDPVVIEAAVMQVV